MENSGAVEEMATRCLKRRGRRGEKNTLILNVLAKDFTERVKRH